MVLGGEEKNADAAESPRDLRHTAPQRWFH